MSSSNVETIRSAYEAYARQDVEGVLAVLAPDVEWADADHDAPPPAGGGTRRGKQEVARTVFPALVEHWSSLAVQTDRYLDAGDHVVVVGRFVGDARNGGRHLDAPFVHVWRLEDGRAVRYENHTDTAAVLEALGR